MSDKMPSSSSKRHVGHKLDASEAPPTKKRDEREEKKRAPKIEIKQFHADVLRASLINEKDQVRMILQKCAEDPVILATCTKTIGSDVKFGDRLFVDAEVLKKKNGVLEEVYIEKINHNSHNGARKEIERYPINKKPFCTPPKFIHELQDERTKQAVVQCSIIDMNLQQYNGCSICGHKVIAAKSCPNHCKDSEVKMLTYARLKVNDFSGMLLVDAKTKTMKKLVTLFDYDYGEGKWLKADRNAWSFIMIMIEIKKVGEDWECTDVTHVDWADYGVYLKEKEDKMKSQAEKRQ